MQRGDLTMVEACRQFGISRKTGYKILHRLQALGPKGLRDQPRAPHTHPNQTSPDVEGSVLRVRKTYPTWGSKKILATLLRREPEGDWPGTQHGRCDPEASGSRAAAQAAPHASSERAATRRCASAERRVDDGLQRLVSRRRRHALRSVDHQ